MCVPEKLYMYIRVACAWPDCTYGWCDFRNRNRTISLFRVYTTRNAFNGTLPSDLACSSSDRESLATGDVRYDFL